MSFMGLAMMRVDRVEFGLECLVAFASVFLRKAYLASLLSTVAAKLVDALVCLRIDCEWHKLVVEILGD